MRTARAARSGGSRAAPHSLALTPARTPARDPARAHSRPGRAAGRLPLMHGRGTSGEPAGQGPAGRAPTRSRACQPTPGSARSLGTHAGVQVHTRVCRDTWWKHPLAHTAGHTYKRLRAHIEVVEGAGTQCTPAHTRAHLMERTHRSRAPRTQASTPPSTPNKTHKHAPIEVTRGPWAQVPLSSPI